MKVLAVIDAQYDFIDGSMGVGLPKWDKAKSEIIALKLANNYDKVIFTKDWHPENHCSFKEFGGIWPAHCVQGTHGANVDVGLTFDCDTMTILKGKNKDLEEYGVDLLADFPEGKVDEVHVVGLCYDYCVANCAKLTSTAHPDVKVIVKKSGTVAIDESATPDFGLATVEE